MTPQQARHHAQVMRETLAADIWYNAHDYGDTKAAKLIEMLQTEIREAAEALEAWAEDDDQEEALDDLDESEFYELYGDMIPDKDGSTLHQLDDKEIHSADPHLVWTVLDCDGKLYLAHGFCFVNRLGYVLATLPWHEDTPPRDYRY